MEDAGHERRRRGVDELADGGERGGAPRAKARAPPACSRRCRRGGRRRAARPTGPARRQRAGRTARSAGRGPRRVRPPATRSRVRGGAPTPRRSGGWRSSPREPPPRAAARPAPAPAAPRPLPAAGREAARRRGRRLVVRLAGPAELARQSQIAVKIESSSTVSWRRRRAPRRRCRGALRRSVDPNTGRRPTRRTPVVEARSRRCAGSRGACRSARRARCSRASADGRLGFRPVGARQRAGISARPRPLPRRREQVDVQDARVLVRDGRRRAGARVVVLVVELLLARPLRLGRSAAARSACAARSFGRYSPGAARRTWRCRVRQAYLTPRRPRPRSRTQTPARARGTAPPTACRAPADPPGSRRSRRLRRRRSRGKFCRRRRGRRGSRRERAS